MSCRACSDFLVTVDTSVFYADFSFQAAASRYPVVRRATTPIPLQGLIGSFNPNTLASPFLVPLPFFYTLSFIILACQVKQNWNDLLTWQYVCLPCGTCEGHPCIVDPAPGGVDAGSVAGRWTEQGTPRASAPSPAFTDRGHLGVPPSACAAVRLGTAGSESLSACQGRRSCDRRCQQVADVDQSVTRWWWY
jgi:hypothetical protein